MSTALRSTLESLVTGFANDVLKALRTASLDDLAVETGRGLGAARATAGVAKGGLRGAPRGRRRLGRRSAEQLGAVGERIVGVLQKHPKGLRAEEIRAQLSLAANELPRPMAELLRGKRVTKTGRKRATKYFVGAGKRAAAPAKRRGRPAKAKKK
ncbi:MAG: hypothetical protein NVS3B10_10150 [Polyangiales bacterium]